MPAMRETLDVEGKRRRVKETIEWKKVFVFLGNPQESLNPQIPQNKDSPKGPAQPNSAKFLFPGKPFFLQEWSEGDEGKTGRLPH
jgi:hypothetical protein